MEHALAAGGAWQQRQQLGANLVGVRLEVFDLGDQALVEIRRRWKTGEEQKGRLLARIRKHRLLQVQMNAHRLFHAPQGTAAVLLRERLHELREPGEAPLAHELLRVIHRALQSRGCGRRVEPATFGLCVVERARVRHDRAHRVAALLVQLREMQTRDMQLRLARERPRVRRGGGLELERRRVGAPQVQMGHGLAAVDRCGTLEQRQRAVDVAVAQRGKSHDVERLDVVRFALEHAAERDLGLLGLALLEK